MTVLRFAVIVCVVVGSTASGAAQTAVAPVLPAAAGMAVPGPIVASEGVTVNGLTVTGRATVTVPADRLHVNVRLFPRSVSYATLDDLAKSVADTMRSAGIRDAHVALPLLGMLGQNSTIAILGTVDRPTRESVEAMFRSVLKAIPDATATALQNGYQVQTALGVDDCAAGEARAQAGAIADARARAARAAAASGVQLGAILAVNENGTFTPFGCHDQSAEIQQSFGTDAYGPLVVPITVTAVVTFAIR